MSCNCYPTNHYETNHSCVEKNCVENTLKLIDRLQRQCESREKDKSCIRCDKPFLGQSLTANTRPVILYLKNGCPFQIAYCKENTSAPHFIFRIEEVKGNCAILRLLIPASSCHHDKTDRNPSHSSKHYIVTKTCVTVDLNEFIAVQCLEDIFLNLKNCQY